MSFPEIHFDGLKAATDKLLETALLGLKWEGPLQKLSVAAGARDVAVIRNRNRRLVAAVTTPDIVEPIADYLAGRAPPNSRQVRVSHAHRPGFRIDDDDYTRQQMSVDPFYQEFLKPLGLFWHANARLDFEPGDELAVSFKRAFKAGPYESRDVLLLDSILPDLKAVARIAHRLLDAEGFGMARALHRRGDPVFELDAWGRVRRVHGFSGSTDEPIRIARGMLRASSPQCQSALDKAVMAAVRSPNRSSLVLLYAPDDSSYFLQIVPTVGSARDVFLTTSALAVLVQRPRPVVKRSNGDTEALRAAFSLTERELTIALCLCEGLTLPAISKELQISVGTTRNHLKSVFDKTGTHNQAALVALLATLGT